MSETFNNLKKAVKNLNKHIRLAKNNFVMRGDERSESTTHTSITSEESNIPQKTLESLTKHANRVQARLEGLEAEFESVRLETEIKYVWLVCGCMDDDGVNYGNKNNEPVIEGIFSTQEKADEFMDLVMQHKSHRDKIWIIGGHWTVWIILGFRIDGYKNSKKKSKLISFSQMKPNQNNQNVFNMWNHRNKIMEGI